MSVKVLADCAKTFTIYTDHAIEKVFMVLWFFWFYGFIVLWFYGFMVFYKCCILTKSRGSKRSPCHDGQEKSNEK
jgi:hypothetical protein